MRNIHQKLRPVLAKDMSILKKRLRVLGLLKDFLKNDTNAVRLLMEAYDASVCEKIAEYRRLDRPIFDNLKQLLISRGVNPTLASQTIIAWGNTITNNVAADLEADSFNSRDGSERYHTERRKSAPSMAIRSSESNTNKPQSILMRAGNFAKDAMIELAKARLGLPLDESENRSIVSVKQSPTVVDGHVRPMGVSQNSSARSCDLEWLFDYAIKRMGTNSFFNNRQYNDEIDIQNERFQDALQFYGIARGKLDALQGNITPEAVMTAQMYLKQDLQPIYSPDEMDDRTMSYYVNRARERFEFDKPKGFIPPTDEEMRDYARQLSHNLVSYKPWGEESLNF